MRFTFDFDSWVWKNQRKSIRKLGTGSLWYRFLTAMTLIFLTRIDKLNWLYNQLWMESSTDQGTVLWAQRYDVHRFPGETFDEFKSRLLFESLRNVPLTNVTRKLVLKNILGISENLISFERVYDHHFTVGGMVGLPIGSRDYAMHAFRIYAPKTADPDFDRKARHAELIIAKINIGANIPELWFDDGVAAGIDPTRQQGRQLSSLPTDPLHNYAIY